MYIHKLHNTDVPSFSMLCLLKKREVKNERKIDFM